MQAPETFQHEQVVVRAGARSGVTVMIAIHSTALGQAVGGCRFRAYTRWQDGLADALKLSEAMSLKCAAAGLHYGGGKTVVALAPGAEPAADGRRAILLDVGDLVDEFGGRYATGPDVGTSAEDMVTVRERTEHVFCLPESHGGSGTPAEPTAVGVLAAIRSVLANRFGVETAAGRRIVIVGLGAVGGRVARALAAQGAQLTVSDVDQAKRELATELNASWAEPDAAAFTDANVLVPAALGGMFDTRVVQRLRCAAVVGPANNQLADEHAADAMHRRGILWAPDFVANAGGAIYALAREVEGINHDDALGRVERIGPVLTEIFAAAERDSRTPLTAATELAAARLARSSA